MCARLSRVRIRTSVRTSPSPAISAPPRNALWKPSVSALRTAAWSPPADAKSDVRELAIVGPPESPVARAALAPFEPNAVVAFGPADEIPLLEGKGLVDGQPAVYVCERFACQAPVTEAAALRD